MQPKYMGKRKVREFVDSAALSIVKAFYPSAVAKYANIPLDEAFTCLLELVDEGELILKWELRCPNYSCVHTFDFYDKKIQIGDVMCPKCGEEFEVNQNDYYPVFELQPHFREDIRQEKKRQIILTFNYKLCKRTWGTVGSKILSKSCLTFSLWG